MRFHHTLPFMTKQRCRSAAARLAQKFGIIDTSVARLAISWPIFENLATFKCAGHEKTHLAISSVCHCKMKFPLHVEVFFYFVGEFHVTVAVTLWHFNLVLL